MRRGAKIYTSLEVRYAELNRPVQLLLPGSRLPLCCQCTSLARLPANLLLPASPFPQEQALPRPFTKLRNLVRGACQPASLPVGTSERYAYCPAFLNAIWNQ